MLVADLLQSAHSVDIIILLAILARHAAAAAAGNVHVLQILGTGRHEGRIVRRLLHHVPEVTHALHTRTLRVATDGGGILHKAQIEGLATVQGLQNHRRSALERILAQLVQLLGKEVARLHRMGLAGLLSVECRHHDHTRRAQFARCGDDVAHRRVELRLDCGILRQDETAETCAYCRNLDVAALERLLDLVHAGSQIAASGLETYDAQILHIIQFLVQARSGCYTLLKRQLKLNLAALLGRACRHKLHGSTRYGYRSSSGQRTL